MNYETLNKARTKSTVAPIEQASGVGYFSHAAALTESRNQGIDTLVELV